MGDLYKHASYTNDKYSNGKYDTVIKLKNSRKKLEKMIADYNLRYQAYVDYMKSRNGDWNDFKGRNDMSGLGLSPGDDDESAGWYYLGDTETVDECKRQALSDDTLYTRVVHYTPDQGYKGNWQYGCYASVPGAKTSSNSRFNAIGVTTADRTYWVDEPVAAAEFVDLPPFNTMTQPASSKNWIYLGNYSAPSGSTDPAINYENGLHACKELAKNPASTVPGMSNAAMYAADAPFSTILYIDSQPPVNNPPPEKFRYTCYGREGQPGQSRSVFLYKVDNTVTVFSPNQSSGTLIYNNANQALATTIYLSVKDLQQISFKAHPSMANIKLTIQDPENTSRYQKWSVTSMSQNGDTLVLIVNPLNDASYKFWSAPNDKNAVVILADTIPGVTLSHQTRCMDAVSGDAGEDGGGNSGPPMLKSQMVKDLQERYNAITTLHQQITGLFTPIPGLSDTLRSEMDKAVAKLKTLEPTARAIRKSVTDLETNSATMDEKDSHVRLHANRYVFVIYTIYAILFICGLVYLFRTDDDNSSTVKYVQFSLGVSVIILVAYHIDRYYNYKS